MSTSGREFHPHSQLEGSPIWGVVYAAGRGERFGGYKQFERIGDERLVDRCIRVLRHVCGNVVVVLPPEVVWDGPPVERAVPGGVTNPESVRAGVDAVPPEAQTIVLHSPSHPLASTSLFRAVLARLGEGYDGACPGEPIHDVLKRVDRHGVVVDAIPKTDVRLVQMPHAFRAGVLRAALAADVEGNDALSIVQRAGASIAVVPGEPTNLHVTNRVELEAARALAPLVGD